MRMRMFGHRGALYDGRRAYVQESEFLPMRFGTLDSFSPGPAHVTDDLLSAEKVATMIRFFQAGLGGCILLERLRESKCWTEALAALVRELQRSTAEADMLYQIQTLRNLAGASPQSNGVGNSPFLPDSTASHSSERARDPPPTSESPNDSPTCGGGFKRSSFVFAGIKQELGSVEVGPWDVMNEMSRVCPAVLQGSRRS